MRPTRLLDRLVVAIAAITVVSGLGQAAQPSLVLHLVGGDVTPTSAHAFGIVGMFMVLFGGLVLQGMREMPVSPAILLWSGLQKVGASVAVSLAVAWGIFSPIALGVATFDFLSAVVVLRRWHVS